LGESELQLTSRGAQGRAIGSNGDALEHRCVVLAERIAASRVAQPEFVTIFVARELGHAASYDTRKSFSRSCLASGVWHRFDVLLGLFQTPTCSLTQQLDRIDLSACHHQL